MQQIFGPRYCETPAVFAQGMFPVEPFNTYSNLVIIFFAILGFGVTLRRAPRAADLHILCLLLLATGLGSFFWHGLRERWALSADVWSGVLFLMALFFLWARRVMPLMQAIVFFVAFFLVTKISDEMNLISYGRWASMMPAIMLSSTRWPRVWLRQSSSFALLARRLISGAIRSTPAGVWTVARSRVR